MGHFIETVQGESANDLPAPLVPAEVDLRAYPYMELDVARLRDSDLAAISSGEAFKAVVLLWCASWHQVPAASLPDDDRLLKRYSGAGAAWKRVREMALRGFVRCSDGRLYHPVIAEKALKAFGKRKTASVKGKAGAEARWGAKHSPGIGLGNSPRNAPAIARAMPTPMRPYSNGTESNGAERSGAERSGEKPKSDGTAGAVPARVQGGKANPSAARPSLQEVKAYCQERRNQVDPQKWFDHYSANGWRVGKHPMKDWRAAVRTWERNEVGSGAGAAAPKPRACSECGVTGASLVETQGGPRCLACYRA